MTPRPGPGVAGEVHVVEVPLTRPTRIGTRRLERRRLVLLRLDEDGLAGWGEASPVPGWHPSPEAVAAGLRRWLEGAEPFPGFGRAAIDAARLDLAGRRTGRSVAALLTERPLDRIPVNALLDAADSEVLAQGAAGLRGRFPAVKLKVGEHDPGEEIARIRTVAGLLGDDTRLRLDANRRWDLDTAATVLGAVEDLDIEYVEEPVATTAELGALRTRTAVPTALDETITDRAAAERAVTDRLADVLVLKPVALGDLADTTALAERAIAAGMGVVVTTALDGAVGAATAIHVAAALPRPVRPCGLATSGFLATDVATLPTVADGSLAVPDRPGLGIDVELP